MMDKAQEAATAAHNAAMTSYTASGLTGGAGIVTGDHILTTIGALMAVATFAVNWIYKHRHYKLAVARFQFERDEQKGEAPHRKD